MKFFKRIAAFFSGSDSKKQEAEAKTGIIKSFNRSRGYGFIHSQDLSKRIFVHITEIKDRFRVGDSVQFELAKNAEGFVAKNVVLIPTK